MAIGIISWGAQQRVRGPRAAASAHVCIVASLAETPKVRHRPKPSEVDCLAALPDLLQRQVPDVAAGETDRGEGGASLYCAVGFQRQNRLSGAAPAPVHSLVAETAPNMFVGPEIADIVAYLHEQPAVGSFLVETCQQWHQFQDPPRLQQ